MGFTFAILNRARLDAAAKDADREIANDPYGDDCGEWPEIYGSHGGQDLANLSDERIGEPGGPPESGLLEVEHDPGPEPAQNWEGRVGREEDPEEHGRKEHTCGYSFSCW